MPGAPIHFLEQAQAQHPNIAADLAEFAELYEKKLWHELTVKLTESLGKPDFHHGDFLVQLYRRAALPRRPLTSALQRDMLQCVLLAADCTRGLQYWSMRGVFPVATHARHGNLGRCIAACAPVSQSLPKQHIGDAIAQAETCDAASQELRLELPDEAQLPEPREDRRRGGGQPAASG